MLFVYLGAVIFGGALVGASALGGDSDVETELDTELDADVDADGDLDGDSGGALGDAVLGWLPFASMRFWTFFLAFGGLTGALLSALGSPDSALVVAGISAGTGYLSGLGITRVMRALKKGQVSSAVQQEDYIGAEGTLLLPARSDAPGQVQLNLRNRVVARAARAARGEIPVGATVSVLHVDDDGTLVVTAQSLLNA